MIKMRVQDFASVIGASSVVGQNEVNEQFYIAHISVDSRSLSHNDQSLFFALIGKNHNAHKYLSTLLLQGVKYFVVQEDFKIDSQFKAVFFKVKNPLTSLQKLAKFHREHFEIPVIGITGSKGKTVVKEWLNFMLESRYKIVKSPKSYNSQTGVPLSVLGIVESDSLAIFEAGISLCGEMELLSPMIQPTIGILTSVTDEHQQGFTSIEQKVEQKLLLFDSAEVIIFEYNEFVKTKLVDKKCLTWSLNDKRADIFVSVKNNTLLIHSVELGQFEAELPFEDIGVIPNIMSCVCCLLYLGFTEKYIVSMVSKVYPVELRLNVKDGVNGCRVIDDAYNADYTSLEIALNFMDKHKASAEKTLILSDLHQQGDDIDDIYKAVNQLIQNHKIKRFIGIGPQMSQHTFFATNVALFKDTQDFLSKVSTEDFQRETILIKGARGYRFDKVVSLLEQKTHQTVLEINLNHIRQNFNVYKAKLKPLTKMMVMVKAFGYGHGSLEIANLLSHEKVAYLGVAFADEGIELRKSGVDTKIIVMNPEINAFSAMIAYDLEPEIYSIRELEAFLNVGRALNCYHYPIHLKLDTGMHRHGFLKQDLDELIAVLRQTNVVKVMSVFSHLSSSDIAEYDDFTLQQITDFDVNSRLILRELNIKAIRHILNTSGVFNFPTYQYDMVRLGIGLYGIGNSTKENELIIPAATLKTTIMQIKDIEVGQSVSYGRRFITTKPTTIATIPIGYADGIPRLWSNKGGYVLIGGKKAAIVGAICMDMMMVDVTDIECKEEQEVIIFGKELPVSLIAEAIGTIPYEIFTGISQRVKRIFYQE